MSRDGHARDALTADQRLLCCPGPPTPGAAAEDRAWALRIAAELDHAFAQLRGLGPAVSVFGSARAASGSDPSLAARAAAGALGRAGFSIITGGGPGVMAAANHGARDAGVTSVGLTIQLATEQGVNPWVDLEVRFDHFFTRKIAFVRYASAFVVLPGGYGTLDELFEALTLVQTEKVRSFPIVLLGRSHWSGLDRWLRAAVLDAGFVGDADLALLHRTDDVDEAVELVTAAAAATVDGQWRRAAAPSRRQTAGSAPRHADLRPPSAT